MQLIWFSLQRHCTLLWLTLCAPFDKNRALTGALLLWIAAPIYFLLQLVHAIFWLIDELLFRNYRKVKIVEPVFIIGPPRSGTTHLHRSLAADERSTTFRTWEAILAPSISQRYLLLGLGWLDRKLGQPLTRIAQWLARPLSGSMQAIHELGLQEPEEDFLALLPAAACFLLVIPYPNASWLWQIAKLDSMADNSHQKLLLAYYQKCIKKHLFVFGQDKRFLSKNASFCGWTESILQQFPEACILSTMRTPEKVVPSQLSSIVPALKLFGFSHMSQELRDRFIDLLAYYYAHMYSTAEKYPQRIAILEESALKANFSETVCAAMQRLGISVSPALKQQLDRESRRNTSYRSSHRYSLEEFGLTASDIQLNFNHHQ